MKGEDVDFQTHVFHNNLYRLSEMWMRPIQAVHETMREIDWAPFVAGQASTDLERMGYARVTY